MNHPMKEIVITVARIQSIGRGIMKLVFGFVIMFATLELGRILLEVAA